MFDVDQDLGGEEVFVAQQDEKVIEKEVDADQIQVTTATTTPSISIDEATLAQSLVELKHAKPKDNAKGIVFHEPEESIITTTATTTTTTTTTTITTPKSKSQDKGKAKMIEEPMKLKKKDQIQLDEEVASKLHAELQVEFDREQRLAAERAQQEVGANIALIKSWDDVQAKIDADYQLVERLQSKEQHELNDEEKAKLFMQLLEKRRKFFTTKRAEEKRNKPPTQAQQRTIMCNYLKNITELVEESSKKAKKEVTEGSSKRAGTELEQESVKKQKIDDDKETTEIKHMVNIIPDEKGIAIDSIPLAVKLPSILDWKIHKEGKKW
nr:hypothetical protein [Tanacetum cinerariifolium]